MNITSEELKALKLVYEYLAHDSPYRDMKKSRYKMLGWASKRLPERCFTTLQSERLQRLLHYRNNRRIELSDKLSTSGILSCGTIRGICNLSGDEYTQVKVSGRFLSPSVDKCDKIVSARKVAEFCDSLGDEFHSWVEKEDLLDVSGVMFRTKHEREYILSYQQYKTVIPQFKAIKKLLNEQYGKLI